MFHRGGDVDDGGGGPVHVWGQEYMGKLCTSAQFCCEPKAAPKQSLCKTQNKKFEKVIQS